ncbi:MAG: glycosyltransferase family protein [Pyrinomonadaceae bacterium]
MNQPPRILFYSHDSFGLGHIRRTLAIGDAVAQRLEEAAVLIITGASAAHSLRIPPGVDYVKLPSVTKVGDEHYESKFLNLDFAEVRSMREEIIFRTTLNYSPDIFFVDNVPLGLKCEIVKTLRYLREFRPHTQVILNLRDVLDCACRVVPQWEANSIYEAVEEFYDRVLVYGSPEVFDAVREYQMPDSLARKVEYVGYIGRKTPEGAAARIRAELVEGDEKLVLVTVGGGADGKQIIQSYLKGLASVPDPSIETHSFIVLGPDMDEESRADIVARYGREARINAFSRLTIVDMCDDLTAFVEAADVVLSMGGYNTMCEVLSLRKRAVVVPRVKPRLEQWVRCTRLAKLGLIRTLHPSEATHQRLLRDVTESLMEESIVAPAHQVNFDGLRHVTEIVGTCCARSVA